MSEISDAEFAQMDSLRGFNLHALSSSIPQNFHGRNVQEPGTLKNLSNWRGYAEGNVN